MTFAYEYICWPLCVQLSFWHADLAELCMCKWQAVGKPSGTEFVFNTEISKQTPNFPVGKCRIQGYIHTVKLCTQMFVLGPVILILSILWYYFFLIIKLFKYLIEPKISIKGNEKVLSLSNLVTNNHIWNATVNALEGLCMLETCIWLSGLQFGLDCLVLIYWGKIDISYEHNV